MSIIHDDRTESERQSHRLAVVGTDRFPYHWHEANNGSYAAWAFQDGEYAACLAWVISRRDMTRANGAVARRGTHSQLCHLQCPVRLQRDVGPLTVLGAVR